MDKKSKMMPSRPTIAFLSSTETVGALWPGIQDGARAHNANLVCFTGNALKTPDRFKAPANILYEIAGAKNVDGIVIWSGGLYTYIGLEAMGDFCRSFLPLPVVTLESVHTGIPGLLIDNYQGIRSLVTHLIQVHHHRKIAFLRGPEGHAGAQLRYQGYVDTLAEFGIPFDPLLVSPYSADWVGMAAFTQLLDDQKANFESLVAVNDNRAMRAMHILKERGKRIPDDVAVVGFDNRVKGAVETPPLTTINPSFYEMGLRAIDLLMEQIAGRPVPTQEYLPTQLIVRQSCGCLSAAIAKAVAPERHMTDRADLPRWQQVVRKPLEMIGITQSRARFVQVARALADFNPAWAEPVWDAFWAEITQAKTNHFILVLEELIFSSSSAPVAGMIWQELLSSLRNQIIPNLQGNSAMRGRAENLIQQGRVLTTDLVLRAQQCRQFVLDAKSEQLSSISQLLMNTFEVSALMDIIARELPKLGILHGYVALYEHPEAPLEGARLILAFDENGYLPLEPGGLRYDTRNLLPPGMAPRDRGESLVVKGLYYQDEQIGLSAFGMERDETAIYDILRGQISSAMKGAMLFAQRNELMKHVADNAVAVNTTSDRLTSLVHKTDQSTNQVAASIAQVSAGAQEQAASATQMAESVEKMVDVIRQVVGIAESGAQETIAAVRSAREGTATIAASVESINGIKNKVDISALKIAALGKQSAQIGLILNTITDMAYQSNILALNAAMEAARAGEHGRGFSVVATEVRRLAEDSRAATQQIGALVREIQRAVTEAMNAIKASTAQVDSGVLLANQAGQALNSILITVDRVNQQVNKISGATQDLTLYSGQMTTAIENIATVSQENSTAAQQVAVAAREMRAQMENMSDSAQSLRTMAQTLHSLLA
jgi:methyl-accepting chemotaxis protein/DNA-binding LacI/PurR family transcriptional regulator